MLRARRGIPRLPTEAEWEKAARGGIAGTRYPWGDTISHANANYWSSADKAYDVSDTRGYNPTWQYGSQPYTSPVASFSSNGYGLYDVAGNLWEWCGDWYSSTYYGSSPGSDPTGPTSGSYRVLRGGSWYDDAGYCRSADRHRLLPGNRYNNLGFRLARTAAP